jgi:hypothetical protein
VAAGSSLSSVSSDWREAIHGKSVSFNPFKLKAARKIIEEAGIEEGDMARITWWFESPLSTTCEHEGPVSLYDGVWIELEPTTRSPGHLRLPIVALTGAVKIEAVESEVMGLDGTDEEIRAVADQMSTNPFIKKHLQKGSSS